MRILHLIASVDPAGGGPIEYARVMAEEHARAGHESLFVTLDPPDAAWVKAFAFPVRASGPAGRQPGPFRPFAEAITRDAASCDVAVVHGLWNPASISAHSALVAAGIPWVVFTHGMLDPWFRKAKPVKHWIKQGYWLLWQGRMLSDASAVLFTCEEERLLAQNAFFGHRHWRERVVAFCAADQSHPTAELEEGRARFRAALPALGERDYLLFLSRIHPKKACDQLIEAFSKIADAAPDLDLVIAGPDQIGWRAELSALADRLGVGARVHWPGMVSGAAKAAAFEGARAFVLPSHQENFGLVVAEALSIGTPVLISDKVNIWREVEAAGAGLVAPDTPEGAAALLRRFLALGSEEGEALRVAARPCYDAHFSIPQAAGDLASVLAEAAAQRTRRTAA